MRAPLREVLAAGLLAGLAVSAGAECPPAWGLPADGPDWCARAGAGADGIPGTPDDNPDCTVNAADGTHSPCNQGQAAEWLLREGNDYCANCPYVFYVVVDCSSSFHLPNHDVEAMRISVQDMSTGEPVLLTVRNECAVRADVGDPFVYCDGCSMLGTIIPKDDEMPPPNSKPAGSCVMSLPIGPHVLPETPCLPLRRTGFTLGWGIPLDPGGDGFDDDGDGSIDLMQEPPCSTCGSPLCACGTDTNANRVTEMQVTDVLLHGAPLLSGVYRIEILSGGLEWQLYSNCDGTATPQFPIFDTCAAAHAAWNPLPELALHPDEWVAFYVEDGAGCPDSSMLSVTTCNRSRGVGASGAPFEIAFDDPGLPPFAGDNTAHPTDPACQGPLAPGECRTCAWIVPLTPAATTATVTLDPEDLLAECSESATNARCSLDARRSQTLGLCDGTHSDDDGDGLVNWREMNLGWNPVASDADGDGLRDAQELERGTSPTLTDTDADGVADAADTCPVTANAAQADSDGDGVGDACEPGARDVLALLSKVARGRLKIDWHFVEGASAHDLAAGDLDTLRALRAHAHDVLECSLPPGFTGRLLEDPAGEGRSRYYVMGSVFPGPDDWGATSRGDAVPAPVSVPACR